MRADGGHPAAQPGLGPLVELTAALARAETVTQICERGLQVVEQALGVSRGSVLLFDEDYVMRFRAWHGISDEYRAATEGHSPWSPDTEDADPVVVADVASEPSFAGLRDVLLDEGIRALAFIPIRLEHRVVGKYMLYFSEPHELTDDELELAKFVADQIAVAVRRKRDERALRSSRDELRAIFSGVADAITVQAPSGELVYANDAAARFLGLADADELVATPVAEIVARFDVLDEDGTPLDVDLLPARQVFAGAPSAERIVRYRVRATGEQRASLVKATPIHGEDGTVRFAVNIVQDVTKQREQMEWQQLLADTSAILSESLVSDETFARVAELAVPRLADWCVIHVPSPERPRLVTVAHRDQERARLALEVTERYPSDPGREGGVGWVLSTGRPHLVDSITDEMLEAVATDEEHLRLLRALELSSAMIVPLSARGRTIAAMTFATGAGRRRFTEEDLANAEEFARRAALAVDNALLHEAEQEARRDAELSASIARRLQDVTASLSGAITRRQVAEVIANQGVLALGADAGAVFVLTEEGDHLEPLSQIGYPDELVRASEATPLDLPGPTTEALRSGEIVVVGSGEELVARWPHYREAQETTGDQATIAVPFVVGDAPGGSMYMAFRSPRTFAEHELELAETLARQCGQALERASLYERERRVALILQRSLLPQRLPTLDQIELTAVYRPGSEGLNVGGDWYDALELPHGRLALCVGDVVGHGLEAAAVMGELRNSVRPYLLDGLPPDEVLARVNGLAAHSGALSFDGETFATLAIAVVDVKGPELSIALAGHPPPLLVSPEVGSRFLDVRHGPPIGVVGDPSYGVTSFAVEPDSTLVLFTDGLVERRTRPLGAGLEELAAAVTDRLGLGLTTEDLCNGILEAMVGTSETADDIAVLAMRLLPRAHAELAGSTARQAPSDGPRAM